MAQLMLAPMAGAVVEVRALAGQHLASGAVLVVLEAMKMEHEVLAPYDLVIDSVQVVLGQIVDENAPLLAFRAAQDGFTAPDGLRPSADTSAAPFASSGLAKGSDVRADLQAVINRHAFILDSARPAAIEKRHQLGMRSARKNVADLCDTVDATSSFVEYGALAIAAQSARRSHSDLIANTPADGILTGIGVVRGVQCVVLAYDMTVLAGTQGMRNHQKTDRMLQIAFERSLPVVLFAEGGGGRPGDTDMAIVAGLHVKTFAQLAKLSGKVPLIGIVAGRCFAGNAALLGCCDLIIATRNSNIGMGGPAMIEGGGLGVFKPEDIGPSDVQHRNGVIDVLVDDEAAAVCVARELIAMTSQLSTSNHTGNDASNNNSFEFADQAQLRLAVPENRLRSYDVKAVVNTLFDADSVLALQSAYGIGIATGFARLSGKPIAYMANNPMHLGGAIDAEAADKLNQFMALANQYGMPIVSFIDTPGFMVGPDIEAKAQVRHASQLFVAAAKLNVPLVAIVLRKGYGLGAMAMAAGGFHATLATIAWPTAEFGAMGLEGAVRLGYRKELDAIADPVQRELLYQQLLAKQYDQGKAINMAETLEIDAVIDPAATRNWLLGVLTGHRQ